MISILLNWAYKCNAIYTVALFVVFSSLDNAAIAISPPLYALLSRDFLVDEKAIGVVTALVVVLRSVSGVIWGFWGDHWKRKPLLFLGSLLWSIAFLCTANSRNFSQYVVFQLIAAIGLGCILSVGFSVATDFIRPERRGLLLGSWSIAQGIGSGLGLLIGGTLGASNWHTPYLIISYLGIGVTLLYLFASEPERGQSEPDLAAVFLLGGRYDYRANLQDFAMLIRRRSNVLLGLAGVFATISQGSMFWMPRLFMSRVDASNHNLELATLYGNALTNLFLLGAFFSVMPNYIGDLWQRANPSGRALTSALGVVCAFPLMVILFLVPLDHLSVSQFVYHSNVINWILSALLTNKQLWILLLAAAGGVALVFADASNRSALIAQVNLPEHRGIMIAIVEFASGIGSAIGNASTGALTSYLETLFPPPSNYAIVLSIFQVFLLAASLCYFLVARTLPRETAEIGRILSDRAKMM